MSWVELTSAWHDTRLRTCQVCGKLITSRAWRFPAEGGLLEACTPECEDLYVTYLRPAHGPLSPHVYDLPA
jgi:hypothetical protein